MGDAGLGRESAESSWDLSLYFLVNFAVYFVCLSYFWLTFARTALKIKYFKGCRSKCSIYTNRDYILVHF